MKEKLETALVELLEKTVSSVNDGIIFLSSEIPEIVEQLLLWKFVSSWALWLVGVCCVIASILLAKAGVKRYKHDYNKYGEKYKGNYEYFFIFDDSTFSILLFLCAFLFFIFAVSFIAVNYAWLQILVAPKLFLIEYIAELI